MDAKDPAVDEIDAREFERAKRDPVVKQFAERADETVKALRRDGRLR